MGLTLQDLKDAMAPLAEIGKGELTFEVNGIAISLRALTPDEEIQVQRQSRAVLSDGDLTDQANALEYLDRFRITSLGYSIVQVGTLDFRNVETIETGEKLPNGTLIRVKRHEAVQQLVSSWSRNMTVAAFKKFGELMNQVEKEVDGLIQFEPVDYDGEISRLEERIRELNDEKARMKGGDEDPRTNLRQQVATSGKSFRRVEEPPASDSQEDDSTSQESNSVVVPSNIDREIVEEVVEEAEILPERPMAASGTRTPVFARSDVRVPPPQPVEAPAASEAWEAPKEEPKSEVMSSLVDMGDSDMAEKAMEDETRRILEMRANAANMIRQQPPHAKAKQVAQEIAQQVEKPISAGTIDGVEVFKMPTQTLTDRKPPEQSPTVPARSNVNPRFKPTRSG